MVPLTIDLQDGFTGEDIVVRVDERQLAALSSVNTRPQLGFAERVQVELEAGAHTLVIEVPSTRQRLTESLQLTKAHFVGVNVRGDKLELRSQDHEFWYA